MDVLYNRITQLKSDIKNEHLDLSVYVFQENGIEVDTLSRANKQIKVTDTELSVIKALLLEKRGRFVDLNIFGNQFVCRLTVSGVLIGKLDVHARDRSHDDLTELDATAEKAHDRGDSSCNNEETIATYESASKAVDEKRIGNARRSRTNEKPLGVNIKSSTNYIRTREITLEKDIRMKGQNSVDDTAEDYGVEHNTTDVIAKDKTDLARLAEDFQSVYVKQSMQQKAVKRMNKERRVSSNVSSCHTDGKTHERETASAVPKIIINDTTEWSEEAGQNTDNKRCFYGQDSGITLKDIRAFVAAIIGGYTTLIFTTSHNEVSALEVLNTVKHAIV